MKVLQIIPTFGVAGAEKVVLNYLKYNQSDTMHIKAISLYPSQNSMYDQEIAARDWMLPICIKDMDLILAW